MSVPGQTMGVSVFTDSLLKSLNLDRVTLSLSYMLGTLSSAFLLPLAGKILDKKGARVLATVASLGLALFLIQLSFSPWILNRLVNSFSLSSSTLAFMITFFCFAGIRHFGQGQLTMASRTMMGLWFEKKRGMVLGVSGGVVALGFGVAPLVLTQMIAKFGWQTALQILALSSLLMAAMAYLFYRRSPESCGLNVDGGLLISQTEESDQSIKDSWSSWTLKEAQSTFTFWVFNLGMLTQALIVTAMTFHMADIAKSSSVSPELAFAIFLPMSVIAIISEVIMGYLSDRFPLKHLLSVMQFFLFVGLLSLQFIETTLGFAFAALGMGVSTGLFALLNGVAWPKLYGRAHLGSIMGLVTGFMVAGSAVGPYLFGLGQSFYGDYLFIIKVCSVLPFIIFLCSFFCKKSVDLKKDKLS